MTLSTKNPSALTFAERLRTSPPSIDSTGGLSSLGSTEPSSSSSFSSLCRSDSFHPTATRHHTSSSNTGIGDPNPASHHNNKDDSSSNSNNNNNSLGEVQNTTHTPASIGASTSVSSPPTHRETVDSTNNHSTPGEPSIETTDSPCPIVRKLDSVFFHQEQSGCDQSQEQKQQQQQLTCSDTNTGSDSTVAPTSPSSEPPAAFTNSTTTPATTRSDVVVVLDPPTPEASASTLLSPSSSRALPNNLTASPASNTSAADPFGGVDPSLSEESLRLIDTIVVPATADDSFYSVPEESLEVVSTRLCGRNHPSATNDTNSRSDCCTDDTGSSIGPTTRLTTPAHCSPAKTEQKEEDHYTNRSDNSIDYNHDKHHQSTDVETDRNNRDQDPQQSDLSALIAAESRQSDTTIVQGRTSELAIGAPAPTGALPLDRQPSSVQEATETTITSTGNNPSLELSSRVENDDVFVIHCTTNVELTSTDTSEGGEPSANIKSPTFLPVSTEGNDENHQQETTCRESCNEEQFDPVNNTNSIIRDSNTSMKGISSNEEMNETKQVVFFEEEKKDDDEYMQARTNLKESLRSDSSGPVSPIMESNEVDSTPNAASTITLVAVSSPATTTPKRNTPSRSASASKTNNSVTTATTTTTSIAVAPKTTTPSNARTPVTGTTTTPTVHTTPRRKKLAEYIRGDLWKRGDPDTVFAALETLCEAAERPEARGAMARTGGLLAVVRCMEEYAHTVDIQIAACRTLEKLALDPENELAIAEVGGIDAILSAMMTHYDNAAVHEAAWSALWNLTCFNAADTLTLDTAGGMEAIVACMKHHLPSAPVQINACGTLRNLCLHHERRLQSLVEAGGLVVMASALQRHWQNATVRQEISQALSTLLESSSSTATEVGGEL